MIVKNFKEELPEFGNQNYNNRSVTTKGPYDVFAEQKISKGTVFFDMKCCCSDPDCKNNISYYYSGLNHYGSSKNLGNDAEVNIDQYHKEIKGRSDNVIWNPTKENVNEFIAFTETAREAIAFKQELLRSLYAELQVRITGYGEVRIMVRKEDTEFRFILFEIPNTFPKVPLLYESKSYRECLGIIAIIPSDTDTSKIKNDYADMTNHFFKPITTWVNLLGKENLLDLVINNIWVMPE